MQHEAVQSGGVANAASEGASRVCALPVDETTSPQSVAAAISNILNFRAYRLLRIFAHEEVVAVKPCQNRAADSLDYVLPLVNMLRQRGITPVVCDTTDRYRNVKRNAIKRMEELATCFSDPTVPVLILDGMKGEHEVVHRTANDLPDVFLAGEVPSLDGAVVVSCVQSDSLSGLSGAIVNMGVGFSSKRGKIRHYSMQIPGVNIEKCYACRRCVRACPVGAIDMVSGHVVIDAKRCINCGRCTEIARFGGIQYAWDATPEHFRHVVVAHAQATQEHLKHRIICINIVDAPPQPAATSTRTILFSRDPVAVDAAARDLLAQHGGLDAERAALASELLARTEALGLGRQRYFIEQVAF